MGYIAPPRPGQPRLNLDAFGMPRDYATYMWIVYRQRVQDDSASRLAFLHRPRDLPDFGQQMSAR